MSEKSVQLENLRMIQPKRRANEPIRFRDVFWIREFNVRKDYGSAAELKKTHDALVAFQGWDPQYPIFAEVAIDSEIAKGLQHLEELWQTLKENAEKPDDQWAKDRLFAFEREYVEKGKLYKPTFLGATGNRRGSQLLDVMTSLVQEYGRDYVIHNEIPILVPATPNFRYPDIGVRMQALIRENESKTEGYKAMSDVERLDAVQTLVEDHGKGQNDIRALYSATLGLRLYFAPRIDLYCRSMGWKIRLMERFLAPKYIDKDNKPTAVRLPDPKSKTENRPNPDHLDFAKFPQGAFQTLTNPPEGYGHLKNMNFGLACETETTFDRANKRRVAGGSDPFKRPTQAEIVDWVDMFENGSKKTASILKREKISNLSESHKNHVVREAMKAVLKDDTNLLNRSLDRAEPVNIVYHAAEGVYGLLGPTLLMLGSLDDETSVALLTDFQSKVSEAVAAAAAAKPADETKAEEPADESSDEPVEANS